MRTKVILDIDNVTDKNAILVDISVLKNKFCKEVMETTLKACLSGDGYELTVDKTFTKKIDNKNFLCKAISLRMKK